MRLLSLALLVFCLAPSALAMKFEIEMMELCKTSKNQYLDTIDLPKGITGLSKLRPIPDKCQSWEAEPCFQLEALNDGEPAIKWKPPFKLSDCSCEKEPEKRYSSCFLNMQPFANQSQAAITCFGGCNSFSSNDLFFSEIKRILKPGGSLRGSVLLRPNPKWKQNLIDKWIKQGLQVTSPTEAEFRSHIERSGLTFGETKRLGDVLLFEVLS
ncbi:MAG: class I SAM-dependent methyltransferase [Bdellovibrionales bacterium]|nr:class I SAM-dependent methyltransferase [Bdellovibrionales bacterium]